VHFPLYCIILIDRYRVGRDKNLDKSIRLKLPLYRDQKITNAFSIGIISIPECIGERESSSSAARRETIFKRILSRRRAMRAGSISLNATERGRNEGKSRREKKRNWNCERNGLRTRPNGNSLCALCSGYRHTAAVT
jgi:hypothetical protein